MKIELRKLKILDALSEETTCYTAEIWIDGERAFLAPNRGHGGADLYQKTGSRTESEVEAWLKQNRPALRSHGIELEPNLELEVGRLIAIHEQTKECRRLLRSHVMTIEDGAVYTYPLKGRPAEIVIAVLKNRRPGSLIVNEGGEEGLAKAVAILIEDGEPA